VRERIFDIFEHDAPEFVIAHGVNCQGAMNSGFARVLRDRYPVIFDSYKKICDEALEIHLLTSALLGQVDLVKVNDRIAVANCFTQDDFGYDGKRRMSYDALDKVCQYLAKSSTLPVVMPLIGGGLGGGNPEVCRAIIKNAFAKRDDCVLYYEPT
jgi:O-acetyl-ADP-ribose deacetylase (regulator of RNase III)